MIIGEANLKKMFPDFQEDIGGNGIDLRVGKVEGITQDHKPIGCLNDEKLVPNYYTIPVKDGKYELLPHNYYFITVDRPIRIPSGYIQTYLLRSTFCRCGLILTSAVGDSGFQGTLMMGLYNSSPKKITIGENERIIQALTWKTDETVTDYSGEYQNNEIYER